MELRQLLLSNFSNKINKGSPVFKGLVANEKGTGTLESILTQLQEFSKEWISTPDIYEQHDELLELTSNFFSYFERYTNESEEAFKKRIRTIFIRNEDKKWGGPTDVINVFRTLFPTGNIFIAENVGEEKDNVIVDGDFEKDEGSVYWEGISKEETGKCRYTKESRFSGAWGVSISDGGSFQQKINLSTEYKSYTSRKDDTYASIAKYFYGTEDYAAYIHNKNPDIEEPLLIGTELKIPALNVMSLHFFLNGNCNVQIETNNGKFWNPKIVYTRETGKWEIGRWEDEPFTINCDTSETVTDDKGEIDNSKKEKFAQKASGIIVFTRKNISQSDEEIKIKEGSIVSDGNGHQFIMSNDGIIKKNQITSNEVAIEAIKTGHEYNLGADTITLIEDETVSDLVTLTNPLPLLDGTDYGWDNKNLLFICPEDIEYVYIRFLGAEISDGFIDYVRCYHKGNYPSFNLIAQFKNYASKEAAALFPGRDDEEITIAHENASYYDNDFLTGVITGGYAKDLYDDILGYIKATGVRAEIEILNRNE